MQRLYQELAGKSFEILAVSVDDRLSGGVPAEALRAFADEFGLTFPILHSAPDDPDNIQRTYQSSDSTDLARFLGQQANGNWILKVADHAGADVGKLNRWALVLT